MAGLVIGIGLTVLTVGLMAQQIYMDFISNSLSPLLGSGAGGEGGFVKTAVMYLLASREVLVLLGAVIMSAGLMKKITGWFA